MRKMERVEQEHDVIRIFYYMCGWHQQGTVENTSGEPCYWPGWLSRPGARLFKACRNMVTDEHRVLELERNLI